MRCHYVPSLADLVQLVFGSQRNSSLHGVHHDPLEQNYLKVGVGQQDPIRILLFHLDQSPTSTIVLDPLQMIPYDCSSTDLQNVNQPNDLD
jgi:hypothetical protein